MKKLSIIFGFLFCMATFVQGQTAIGSSSDLNINTTDQARLNILSSIFINQSLNTSDSGLLNQNNQVVIQQIGNNNVSNLQTRANTSNIELIQNGNFNRTLLSVNAPSIEERITQNGDNNSVLENIYYSNLPVGLDVIQNGDNLTVNRIGTNSLTNRMQLIQQGNSKTITIISN